MAWSDALAELGQVHAGRADLIYGATGSTKTSRLGDIAEYVMRRYQQPSRLISADPGGWEPIEGLVHEGIIKPFAVIQHRRDIYETMAKLCLGYWPANPEDAQSPLLPPKQNGLQNIGAILIEGLTSWCDILMHVNLTDMQRVKVPEMPKDSQVTSGEYVRRFSGRSDYGGIQDTIADFVRDSGTIPVKRVVWTALENMDAEDESKRPTYGPDLIGKKATARCGPWFGNMFHLMKTPVRVERPDPVEASKKITVVKLKPMVYLCDHINPDDPRKIPWPAKTRAPKALFDQVPDVMPPDMDAVYEMLAKLQAQDRDKRGKK